MFTIHAEFTPLASDLPANVVPMFNAPARTTLPDPRAWQPHKWRPEEDAKACAAYLQTLAPGDRVIVFPWALFHAIPPQPQHGETPEQWADVVIERAARMYRGEPPLWAINYLNIFLTVLARELPNDPGPTLLFDEEVGWKIEHMEARALEYTLPAMGGLTRGASKVLARDVRERMLRVLTVVRPLTTDVEIAKVDKRLAIEPVATLKKRVKQLADALWDGCCVLNFGDNGTERRVSPGNFRIPARSEGGCVDDDLSCPVFYIGDLASWAARGIPDIVGGCLDFADECWRTNRRSLPVLCLNGHEGTAPATTAAMARGLHTIGYRRLWLFNGYDGNVLAHSAARVAHSTRETDTVRTINEATA